MPPFDILLLPYAVFQQLNSDRSAVLRWCTQHWQQEQAWSCVVLDDVHTIKSHTAKTCDALAATTRSLPFHLLLTCTPVDHSSSEEEVARLLALVEPSLRGSLGAGELDLAATLKPYMLRWLGSREGRWCWGLQCWCWG